MMDTLQFSVKSVRHLQRTYQVLERNKVLDRIQPEAVDWVTTELRNLAKQRIEDLDSSQVERTIEQYIDLDFPSRIEGLSFKVVPIAIYI